MIHPVAHVQARRRSALLAQIINWLPTGSVYRLAQRTPLVLLDLAFPAIQIVQAALDHPSTSVLAAQLAAQS